MASSCVLQREGEVPLESLQILLVSSSRSVGGITMLPLPTAMTTPSLWAPSQAGRDKATGYPTALTNGYP